MKTRRHRGGVQLGDLGLALVAAIACFPFRNNDLWWHLAAGRFMTEHHRFIREDPFSYTGFMGSWIDNEWLSQLVFFATWSVGSIPGLLILRAATYAILFLLLRGYLRAARAPSVFLPALIVGVAVSYPWWELRPSAFSLVCLVGLLWILERFRRSGRDAWLLPPLFLVWANLYPGFVFGLVVLLATLAAWSLEPILPRWRRWAAPPARKGTLLGATAVAAFAPLVNPYGWGVYRQQLDVLRNAGFRAALDEYSPPALAFFVFVVGCCTLLLVHRFRRISLPSLVPILGTAAISVTAVKFQEHFAVVGLTVAMTQLGHPRPRGRALALLFAIVLAALGLSAMEPLPTILHEGSGGGAAVEPVMGVLHWRLLRNAGLLALVLGASLWSVPLKKADVRAAQRRWRSALPTRFALAGSLAIAATTIGIGLQTKAIPDDGVEPGRYPTTCLSALPKEGEGRVFNQLSWGGWLIWHLRLQTYIDGRGWGQPLFFEYQRMGGPEGPSILRAWGVEWAIVRPHDPLVSPLLRDPDWGLVCADDASVVLRYSSERRRQSELFYP